MMNWRRVRGLLAWACVAIMLGWPSYELLNGIPERGSEDSAVETVMLSDLGPSPLPTSYYSSAQPDVAELTEPDSTLPILDPPVEDTALIDDSLEAPIPAPAPDRTSVFHTGSVAGTTGLGYAPAGLGDSDLMSFEEFLVREGRPVSANPFFTAPPGDGVSSGDYLLEESIGGGGQGFFLDEARSRDGRPGHFLDEYQRGIVRPGRSSATVNIGN